MKINTIFLIIGLILSVISKIYHFKIKSQAYIGNIIVIPAAVCFCLAILFSINKYNIMFSAVESRTSAILLAIYACGTVVSFQLMMINIVGGKITFGLIFAIPFLLLLTLFLKAWF